MDNARSVITIGVLALQGAFSEHLQLLQQAITILEAEDDNDNVQWRCREVRTPGQLAEVDALILPGGESTAIALVAERSGLLEPLRNFVKVQRKAVWGTCAGMILLAEAANRTKQNGQELIGGLDVRVNRNHFGRQVESFETFVKLPFLQTSQTVGMNMPEDLNPPFKGVFIRAPIVEKILAPKRGVQTEEAAKADVIVAPSRAAEESIPANVFSSEVEVLATLPTRRRLENSSVNVNPAVEEDIIAVKQGNVLATSFHPELTEDCRIHAWWLRQIRNNLLIS